MGFTSATRNVFKAKAKIFVAKRGRLWQLYTNIYIYFVQFWNHRVNSRSVSAVKKAELNLTRYGFMHTA